MLKKNVLAHRRKQRVRRALARKSFGRPRLSVFRSSKQIYAQVIDDTKGVTLVSASSLEKEQREAISNLPPQERAKIIGLLLAKRALEKGISAVVFDRGPYLYHGRVKALAEGAREAGLLF